MGPTTEPTNAATVDDPATTLPIEENATGSMLAPVRKRPTLKSYLEEIGYAKSLALKKPVDQKGDPLPWYTYSSIYFLEPRIKQNFHVFEYGCGNSTLWWAQRTASVTSCEHHSGWAEQMRANSPAHATIIQHDLVYDGDYCRAILDQDRTFDIIVNDGRDRVNCSRHLVEKLAATGVVIWDNAERSKYREGYKFLIDKGFRRLDFKGLGPIAARGWTTSIFYRDGNCLGI